MLFLFRFTLLDGTFQRFGHIFICYGELGEKLVHLNRFLIYEQFLRLIYDLHLFVCKK